MAINKTVLDDSIEANGDLSSNQHTFHKLSSDGQLTQCDTKGEEVYGVLQNKPGSAGEAAEVAVFGIAKVEAGESINEMDPIATAADGQAITATDATVDTTTSNSSEGVSGSNVVGLARSAAGGAGELVEVLLTHPGAVPSTDA